jgi:hypothetical protein
MYFLALSGLVPVDKCNIWSNINSIYSGIETLDYEEVGCSDKRRLQTKSIYRPLIDIAIF